MKKTWENSKKPSSGPDFGPFGPILGQNQFLTSFTATKSYTLLQAIIACNFFSRKTNKQNLIKWQKKLVLDPILTCLAQIRAVIFFRGLYLYWMLDIVSRYHCIQFQGKLILIRRPILASFVNFFPLKNLALSATRYHGQLSSSTNIRKN